MVKSSDIKEHMEIVGSDGKHVGMVDQMEGSDRIKLTKSDDKSGGKHHFIALSTVASVDSKIHLSKSAQAAMQEWQSAA
jgi:hypothetical protein